jgi:toxin-antitoxin system PIN domain toxin
MMLADSNIWLALSLSKHAFHGAARTWLVKQQPPAIALFCRSTQQSFLRLLTTSAVLAPFGVPALSNKAAWSIYDRFRAEESTRWAEEPRGLESQWKKFAGSSKSSPKLWMDAYLAAFAVTGDLQLVTTDKAFKQFKGLDLLMVSD